VILDVAGSSPVGRPNRPRTMPYRDTLRDLVPSDDLVLLTCAEMAKADAYAIAHGVPGIALMEAAGRAVALAVMQRHARHDVVVLCGPGNNGGDGFVAARHLREAGWPVRLVLVGDRQALRGDAAGAADAWAGNVEPWSDGLVDRHPLIVDALFGAGLSRPIDGAAAVAIDRINLDDLPVIAVDVPSGLHGDTGEVLGRALRATCTVTFFRGKPGHYSVEGLRRCGDLKVVDIGIPPAAVAEVRPRAWLNAPLLWRHVLRRQDVADHKYARGHLTILGGALATGAARLAALAGRRAGAGLVTIAAMRSTIPALQAAEPGNLIVDADDGTVFQRLLADERRNAILIGPGSGVSDRTKDAVLAALAKRRSVVLDADAISVFATDPDRLFGAIDGPTLLTPHEGEFRRLFPDIGAGGGKVERVRRAAALSGATILLKGPDTVIAAPDGRAIVNVHASPALATAGSGDVLAGIAGGLLAQGVTPLAAAAAAAWIHGESARGLSRPGLIAEDLPSLIPEALQRACSIN
jgi:ADP-dependent NAD(P)H-hydrate dehydratase / NAD(P)H-hydrate epimerase